MNAPASAAPGPPRPGLLQRVRRRVGFAKYVLLDGGHREVRYKMRLAQLDRRAARLLDRLAREGRLKPVATPARSEIEMHALCGHRFVTMGIWSFLSLLRFAEGKVALVVHSDGTITDADAERFRRFFTHVTVVQPEESRRRVEQRLDGGDFGHLEHFHAHCHTGPKLIAPHMSEGVRTVVVMDTDVLFFRRPDEVLAQAFRDDGPIPVTSFSDDFDWLATVGPHRDFEAACGVKIVPRFNSGMLVMRRFDDEHYRFLERSLRACKREWREHYFAEQVMLALMAGGYGWNELPRDRYRIASVDPNADGRDYVAIHYVSNKAVRPRFYTEGLPRLIRDLEATGSL